MARRMEPDARWLDRDTALGYAGPGRESLSGLLKRCRARVVCDSPSLGAHERMPIRVGKAVTQEEVAEAAGISRQWYAMLENDRPVRVSAIVLARIADALMMDAAERATLFRLAVPELRSTPLTDHYTAVLNALGSLRRLTRRLEAATAEAQILTLVREYAMMLLEPDLMATCTRVGAGRWDHAVTGDDHRRAKAFHSLLRKQCGAATDNLLCYPSLAQPGEVMIRAWSDVSVAVANIRSRGGLDARLVAVHHTGHAYTEDERTNLSALASLASLALPGYDPSPRVGV